MNIRQTPDAAGMDAGLDAVEQQLGKCGLKKKELTKARLISEELMTSLIGHADADAAYMLLSVRKWLGEIVVEISVPCAAYDFSGSLEMGVPLDGEEIGRDAEITIISAVGQFGSLSEMGKTGGKVLGLYLLTTVAASAVGIGIGCMFRPGGGVAVTAAASDISAAAPQGMDISIRDMIVNIVPSNFAALFLEANMLQLIFLAVVCGIASGMIGSHGKTINDLFQRMQRAVFENHHAAYQVYADRGVLLHPVPYPYNGSADAAAGTEDMRLFPWRACDDDGGILPDAVCAGKAQSAPVYKKIRASHGAGREHGFKQRGASAEYEHVREEAGHIAESVFPVTAVRGDDEYGRPCVYLGVAALALAKLYGAEIVGTSLLPIAAAIILLSIGAPGVSGAGFVCLSVLLPN